MGLDMYAYACAPDALVDPTAQVHLQPKRNIDGNVEGDFEELAYWRKFNHLHGWMEDLYRAKGGEDTFNCESVRIDADDLDKLEAAVNAGPLPPRNGFFFGDTTWLDEDKEDVLKFVANARAEIAAGRVVFYDSWW